MCSPSPSVSLLPAGAQAGWNLCFDQAVVFIEDAIQVGSACSQGLGLGLWPGLWGLGDWLMATWMTPFLRVVPEAEAGIGRLCGHRSRDGPASGLVSSRPP